MTPRCETGNKLVIGATRSGKSVSEVNDIIAAAMQKNVAIVLIDPHPKSLAWNVFVQLVARGMESRIIYDQLSCFTHVPGYRFLPRSVAVNPLQKAAEQEQYAHAFTDILCRRRSSSASSLATSPQTEEWTLKAIRFLLSQRRERPASDLQYAFSVGHPVFQQLLHGCRDSDIAFEFKRIADGTVRSSQFASAQRLITGVCGSPAFVARCGTCFDLPAFLDHAGILIVEGGSEGISADAMRTIMGSLILQVIQHVRSRTMATPRVLLVLDEATNANLVSQHEVHALAECQKMGLDIHILVQLLDFPTSQIAAGVMTNCIRHDWFYASDPTVARKAADDLGLSPEQASTIRQLRIGERYIKTRDGVRRDRVQMLSDPWVWSGLSLIKSKKALSRIRKRPEYLEVACQKEFHGETVTMKSSDGQHSMSAQPDTSSPSSRQNRQRTDVSTNSSIADPFDRLAQ